MGPRDAGFNGEKGLSLNISSMIDGGFMKLRRSSTMKPQPDKYNFKNQLIWYYPENEEPVLYYCNEQNQLFTLDFIPCHT